MDNFEPPLKIMLKLSKYCGLFPNDSSSFELSCKGFIYSLSVLCFLVIFTIFSVYQRILTKESDGSTPFSVLMAECFLFCLSSFYSGVLVCNSLMKYRVQSCIIKKLYKINVKLEKNQLYKAKSLSYLISPLPIVFIICIAIIAVDSIFLSLFDSNTLPFYWFFPPFAIQITSISLLNVILKLILIKFSSVKERFIKISKFYEGSADKKGLGIFNHQYLSRMVDNLIELHFLLREISKLHCNYFSQQIIVFVATIFGALICTIYSFINVFVGNKLGEEEEENLMVYAYGTVIQNVYWPLISAIGLSVLLTITQKVENEVSNLIPTSHENSLKVSMFEPNFLRKCTIYHPCNSYM